MEKKCTAIVLAAGQGKRMGSQIPKQFLLLRGFPVLYYSLKCFQDCEWIQDIILVTNEESVEYVKEQIVEELLQAVKKDMILSTLDLWNA